MKANPLISVVIPTHNCGSHICDAVDSARAQTYAPIEIIVVDDGSTDNTVDRLKSLRDRVRYAHQHNQGVSAARNLGIELAKGEFIALLDADDVWHPQKLERQMWIHHRRSDIKVSGTSFLWFVQSAPKDLASYSGEPLVRDITLKHVLTNFSFGSCSGALIHRGCFEQVGSFDISLRVCEDLDLWLRVAARFPIAKLMEPLTYLRNRMGSLSSDAEALSIAHRLVLNRAFATLPQLKGQVRLHRMALAALYRHDASVYFGKGQRGRAIQELLHSAVEWPLPLPTPDRNPNFVRAKMLIRYCLP